MIVAGQEGDGRELPGMMPKKLLPRVVESRCAAAISCLPPPGPSCSTCNSPHCQVAEEEEEEAALPPETHLDFLPGAAAVAAAQVARAAHLQPEGLPANQRQEQEEEGMRSGIRVSEGFVYQDPCREGGSGFSDTLQPPAQTLSGKSVSDKIRIKK